MAKIILTAREDGIVANHVPNGQGAGCTMRGMKERQAEDMLRLHGASDAEIADTMEILRQTGSVEVVLP